MHAYCKHAPLISSSADQHPSSVGSKPHPHTLTRPPSLLSTSLLSYDRCYVFAAEHKVALLVAPLCPLGFECWESDPLIHPSHGKQTGPCVRRPAKIKKEGREKGEG